MKFFDEKERFALEQVAERINKLQGADWNNFHGSDFLEPEIFGRLGMVAGLANWIGILAIEI